MIAALPMYDWPEVQWANDALWSAIGASLRAHGVDAPAMLTRDIPLETIWRHPDLLLAQTCGYPYVRMLRPSVTLVGTPAYTVRGCSGANYRSVVVVRADHPGVTLSDFRGARVAYNDASSQSGYSALRAMVAALARGKPFFAATQLTGAHAESMRAVAEGRSDLCAVDCVCWALANRLRPELVEGLRVLDWGPVAPGLPVVVGPCSDRKTLRAVRESIRAALGDPSLSSVRDALFLGGFECLVEDDYARITELEASARALRYPELV